MPQLAILIDRANLKSKAGEFEQLSVTDALTGLLNRRYLEERLTEEIKRSNRHDFPLSFMMIDVDEFKSYNDSFGHTEGDKALQTVGGCLKKRCAARMWRRVTAAKNFRFYCRKPLPKKPPQSPSVFVNELKTDALRNGR